MGIGEHNNCMTLNKGLRYRMKFQSASRLISTSRCKGIALMYINYDIHLSLVYLLCYLRYLTEQIRCNSIWALTHDINLALR